MNILSKAFQNAIDALIKKQGAVKLKGHYKFIVTNENTGDITQIKEYDNLVPTIGRSAFASQIAGSNTQECEGNAIGIGTGTTAPANGDTALETETHRKAVSSGANSDNVATISTNFTVADLALGVTTVFKEAGILGDGSAVSCQTGTPGGTGILYSRVAINVSVSTVESLTVEFTMTFS